MIGQGVSGDLQLSPLGKSAGLQGEGRQRRLPPELKERLEKAVEGGIQIGLGYHKIWRMLRASGLEISSSTVQRYYYKMFPERRSKRGSYLDRGVRIRLFEEVKRLRGRGYSYGKIIKMIEKEYGYRLDRRVVSDWLRGVHSPYNGCRIPSIDHLEKSLDLCYVIGAVAGDGWIFRRKISEMEIGCGAEDREFIEEFARCLGSVLGRDPPKPRLRGDGLLYVAARSKALYDLVRKPINIEGIKPFVEHCEDCTRSFLKGFFDSVASVRTKGYVECYNTDERLLNYVKELLSTHDRSTYSNEKRNHFP